VYQWLALPPSGVLVPDWHTDNLLHVLPRHCVKLLIWYTECFTVRRIAVRQECWALLRLLRWGHIDIPVGCRLLRAHSHGISCWIFLVARGCLICLNSRSKSQQHVPESSIRVVIGSVCHCGNDIKVEAIQGLLVHVQKRRIQTHSQYGLDTEVHTLPLLDLQQQRAVFGVSSSTICYTVQIDCSYRTFDHRSCS